MVFKYVKKLWSIFSQTFVNILTLLRMTFEEVTYETETKALRLKLKPIFQALKILKDNAEIHSKEVATQSKVSNEELLQILSKNIEISLKSEVATLKKLSITKEEPLNETLSVNGAGDGNSIEFITLTL